MPAISPERDAEPLSALRASLRYDVDVAALLPRFKSAFTALDCDAETEAFLAAAQRGRHGWLRTRLHRLLRMFMSDFDVNGLLDMYPLHVASSAQWRVLLGPERVARLLDVGAGSGRVTRTLLPFAEFVVSTELSKPMARALRRTGIECHTIDVSLVDAPGPGFDLISCLNVLDRTARPKRMLRRLVDRLEPGGRLLIALALPYRPFYYQRATTPAPLERLDCAHETWEGAVNQLVARELEPLGLTLLRLARAPYLSFGDAERGSYELDDALLLLKKA